VKDATFQASLAMYLIIIIGMGRIQLLQSQERTLTAAQVKWLPFPWMLR
jgi:hypothetical protein